MKRARMAASTELKSKIPILLPKLNVPNPSLQSTIPVALSETFTKYRKWARTSGGV